jgi:hypothetical protein
VHDLRPNGRAGQPRRQLDLHAPAAQWAYSLAQRAGGIPCQCSPSDSESSRHAAACGRLLGLRVWRFSGWVAAPYFAAAGPCPQSRERPTSMVNLNVQGRSSQLARAGAFSSKPGLARPGASRAGLAGARAGDDGAGPGRADCPRHRAPRLRLPPGPWQPLPSAATPTRPGSQWQAGS